jgi:glycosyltransferase involved in cell wall biosynthesis
MLKPEVIVVTPVYEDVEAATCLFKELRETLDDLFIVAVDDGSVREVLNTKNLKEAALPGVVINLKKNIGHQRAIAVGLSYVAENFPSVEKIIVMDSDGEDTPSSISDLLAELDNDNIDIAVAERRSRVETLKFKAFYLIYRFIFTLLTGRVIKFGNFMALNAKALKRIVSMQELWVHVAACVLGSKLRIGTVSLDRGKRYKGNSKMNFVGLALHGFRALMVFIEDVLVRVGIVCAVIALFSVVGGLIAITLKLFGFATPGWFSTSLGILFLVFLQTGAITLMTLMLTGVVRNNSIEEISYKSIIDAVNTNDTSKT